tara:strand:- start:315 stop:626 length:312 start_codon:yes stop_codon:yes gene_type:complete
MIQTVQTEQIQVLQQLLLQAVAVVVRDQRVIMVDPVAGLEDFLIQLRGVLVMVTEVITNHQKEILVVMVVQIILTIQLMVAVAVLELQVKKLTLTELVMVVLV